MTDPTSSIVDGEQPCTRIPADLIETMKRLLPCQSKDVVMDVLGVSSNTWLKIKRGQPSRRSIAERLANRFRTDNTSS